MIEHPLPQSPIKMCDPLTAITNGKMMPNTANRRRVRGKEEPAKRSDNRESRVKPGQSRQSERSTEQNRTRRAFFFPRGIFFFFQKNFFFFFFFFFFLFPPAFGDSQLACWLGRLERSTTRTKTQLSQKNHRNCGPPTQRTRRTLQARSARAIRARAPRSNGFRFQTTNPRKDRTCRRRLKLRLPKTGLGSSGKIQRAHSTRSAKPNSKKPSTNKPPTRVPATEFRRSVFGKMPLVPT